MNDLEKLTEIMSPAEARAARHGYALGHHHADQGRSEALPWPESPEWAIIESLTGEPKVW